MEKLSTMKLLPELLVGAQYDIARQLMLIWGQIRASLVYMAIVVAFNKLFGKTPEKRYKWEPFEDNVELGSSIYPLVLVQVPMFNEKEVYQLSIGATCGLSWSSDRIVIQVLDDSTYPLIKVIWGF
ncbi:putative glucomannan 4-beta-mannosyltransferase [Helianthus debilis subsp. tardiflorus]